ncbi:MAG TPA: response regulator [Candidatus Limnocylindria bacterium]|nr:response regulator [Candidatus Limnocylindria bacterium]
MIAAPRQSDGAAGTILLIDEDRTLRTILRANFEVLGYAVVDAHDADGALRVLDGDRLDAIVLDVPPRAVGGAALVRRIRKHPRGSHVPLIVLTGQAGGEDAVRSLEAGADDVVARPFDPEEMLARVRGKIRRAEADTALQPLTKLPGNGPIEAEIRRRLDAGAPWSVLYLDLDGFKAFNDAFGFAKGDDVIRLLASAIVDAVRRHGGEDDFVGHVGGDDLIAVTTPARADTLAEAVIGAFDRGIRALQRDTRVPYCTVSIAIVSGSAGPTTYAQVGERAAAVKKEAKRRRGSVAVTEGELR